MKALWAESQIYHSRKINVKNSFFYRSLFVFFNTTEQKSINTYFKTFGIPFFSLNGKDYLKGEKKPLKEAIESFVVKELDYAPDEVWLLTMPRMLGYVFNPVSFWFFKRGEEWEACLCEVNNTFGERHFYWLDKDKMKLNQWVSMKKNFHVSPFQKVEGHYEFLFSLDVPKVKIKINYFNRQKELSLETGISGCLMPIQSFKTWRILIRYGWMTTFVMCKIHWQALILWVRRAKFFTKPPKPDEEVSR